MRVLGVAKAIDANETRVALVPEVVGGILRDKLAHVVIEASAGQRAGFSDQDYEMVGAAILPTRDELISRADYILAVDGNEVLGANGLKGKTIIGLFDPFFHQDGIRAACSINATIIALELIPRISRAQSMDVLSSQANIAGYVSVVLAASKLPKIIPLMMTAAGTIKPAKILVVGAGVAGLQAIATAKRMGAVVFSYDVRAAVKEQVESLGAKFVDIRVGESGEGSGGYAKTLSEKAQQEQREKLSDIAKDMDVVITTAQIPGRKAPVLLDERVFSLMKRDSVIIDLAAASGGNVPGSIKNQWLRKENVWLFGADNLASLVPKDASFTFAKNMRAFLDLLLAKEELDFHDEILCDSVICHQGSYVNRAFSQMINNH
ncbi:MAG TPA: NAD(P) transhydrogenase subunit alpha [Myxococcota bacterium]|nr:NAD(P) transhydrogenase subunit alpha [Myxococcota bacterium]